MPTSLENAVVLVTGANGGLGEEFVAQALARGAAKVYATARTPRAWDDSRVVPLALDVTSAESVAAAVTAAPDTTILINNAGISRREENSFTDNSLDAVRALFETNFFGAVRVVQEFAPVLDHNGGGAIVDVHSVLSWIGISGIYSATKAAFWSATNSFRLDLAPQGTHVLGLHLGYTATPMTRGIDAEMGEAADVVRDAYDGLEAGAYEVLADQISRDVKAGLAEPLEALYPQLVGSGVASA
ncbi:short-chain dehydrogenase [Frondihabitans sp. PAMC 28766]|uniref:SDR family oxidoreductase n=1 Tax=Frondihabitans sp. PAMC 28766 TaxID=1795630 RepID=UPI00078B8730|nr:SDR family oxidoreductase [Frondihabitans sp. PAMC 28766]AMM19295.1 short-chain dehydrogenase [Frondihabitans sp. PAMC 28766]